MQDKSKFLILNPSIDGLIKVLEKSNTQYTKNGPFEATILLGDVIPEGKSIPKDIELQAQTYLSKDKLDISEEIKEKIVDDRSLIDVKANLTYSRPPYCIIRLKSNLVFMILNDIKEEHLSNIPTDVNIDVIISNNNWPSAIAMKQNVTCGNEIIDKLIKQFTPRYIFSHSKSFFELEPFKWDNGIVTRFLSLAEEGSGEKWFYAFSIGILQDNDLNLNLINNPFMKKRQIEEDEKETEAKKIKVVTPDKCFFCLSNASTETHMIVSIGSYNYLTIAKGPLTRSNKDLSFSGHGIIIPIEHIPSIIATNLLAQDSPIFQEQLKYEKSLVEAFKQSKFKLVFFEISRLSNIHKHVQFIPIEEELLEKFQNSLDLRVKINNTKHKKNQKLKFKKCTEEDLELKKILDESDFISFKIYHNDKIEFHIAKLEESGNVDLQFPRRVLAHLLNLPDRIYWDKCQQPKLKEMSDCEEFKKFYSNYDFTK
ncbi:unnamed protein product [Candida verbasci]|uniref:CWF19-like protein DRN1 n=1 Tax=Candida verbasci TaxID=1227364 RepID=A0A9W4TXR1_9ASCO|nr:unnamed protein product [Candida verbasci]